MTRLVELGAVAQVVDCEHRTAPKAAVGVEYGYSIGTRDVKGGRIDYAAAKRVDADTFDSWTRRAVPGAGDLILAREAPVGEVGYIDGSRPVCLGQRTVMIRLDESRAHPRYIHYQLLAPQAQEWMAAHCEGSTVVHLNVSDVRRIPLELPPLDEQRRIANVLALLDDLIATNELLGQNLNALASAQGQRLLSLLGDNMSAAIEDIASITKGYSYKSAELTEGNGWLVGLKNVGRRGEFRAEGFKPLNAVVKPAQVVENGDLVVAHTDLTQAREVIGRPVRVRRGNRSGTLVASLDLAIVRPNEDVSAEYLQAVLESPAFREHALGYCNGTTVLHMGSQALPSFPVHVPSSEEMQLFDELAPLRAAADDAYEAADDLRRVRDELLPLLVSGKVGVDPESVVA